MARRIRLLCHHCGERFVWEHEGWPDECPLCHSYVGSDGKPEVAAPYIATRAGKSGDAVYKAMEQGAEHRANVAMEMGVPREEASAMRITNMRDNAVMGENSAPKLTAEQAQMMRVASNTTRESVVSRFGAEHAHPRSGVGSGISQLHQIRSLRSG